MLKEVTMFHLEFSSDVSNDVVMIRYLENVMEHESLLIPSDSRQFIEPLWPLSEGRRMLPQ